MFVIHEEFKRNIQNFRDKYIYLLADDQHCLHLLH